MTSIFNTTQNKMIIENLTVADNFKTRAQGLIGTTHMDDDSGVWFPKSNWIHTCFMSMTIDVIYLDKKMCVKKLQPNLKPWRFPAPVFSAHSVLEVPQGFIQRNNIQIGDILNVGH